MLTQLIAQLAAAPSRLVSNLTCEHENTTWTPMRRGHQDEGTCPDCNRHIVKYG